MGKLGIRQEDLCSGAYQDMLAAKAQPQSGGGGGGGGAGGSGESKVADARPGTVKPEWWG